MPFLPPSEHTILDPRFGVLTETDPRDPTKPFALLDTAAPAKHCVIEYFASWVEAQFVAMKLNAGSILWLEDYAL